MVDPILDKMFDKERIEYQIEKLRAKGVNRADLRKLKEPTVLLDIYKDIISNTLEFVPGHLAPIPKDNGKIREVYVGETTERFLCGLVNDVLFELFPSYIHPRTRAYQKGIGNGLTVKEFSDFWYANNKYSICKFDYSKFFDKIYKAKVMELLDKLESELGYEKGELPSFNMLRRMYNNDWLFDLDGNLIQRWSGIRQGNAVGSFMADAIIYEIDEYMSTHYPFFVRYCDDSIVITDNTDKAYEDMVRLIEPYGVGINEDKFEVVEDKFIKFLGYSVRENIISLSKSRIASFVKEIRNLTVNYKGKQSLSQAVRRVMKYLYKGNGEHSWATQVLAICNSERDLQLMNAFVMDCLRAVATGRKKVGSLGCQMGQYEDGVIESHEGKDVGWNKKHTPKEIKGYVSLIDARNALLQGRDVFDVLIDSALCREYKAIEVSDMTQEECLAELQRLYDEYNDSVPTPNDRCKQTHFKGKGFEELTMSELINGQSRDLALVKLEGFMRGSIESKCLTWQDDWGTWYHRMENGLILLKEWFVWQK